MQLCETKKLILLFLIGLLLIGCGGTDGDQDISNDEIHKAVYAMVGYCWDSNVSYLTPSGMITETLDHSVWVHPFDAQNGDYLYLHVSNPQCIHPFDAYLILDGEIISKGSCSDPNCQEITLSHIIEPPPSPK